MIAIACHLPREQASLIVVTRIAHMALGQGQLLEVEALMLERLGRYREAIGRLVKVRCGGWLGMDYSQFGLMFRIILITILVHPSCLPS